MQWGNLIFLVVFGGLLLGTIVFLKPRLRERRHRIWEEAGLLPHQVDTAHGAPGVDDPDAPPATDAAPDPDAPDSPAGGATSR